MKKQIFAIALLTISTALFAPAFTRGVGPAAGVNKGTQAGTKTINSASGLVAAFPGSEADLVAGAIAASGVNASTGSASSKAGLAAQSFVKTGSAQISA